MILAASFMEVLPWLLGCIIAIVFSGIYSGSETGIYSLNSTRLRLDSHDGQPAAIKLEKLMTNRAGLLFSALVGTNVANYLAPFCLTAIFVMTLDEKDIHEREQLAELYATLILTPTVFIFGEVVPKNLFHAAADTLMRRFATFIYVTDRICRYTGVTYVQQFLTHAITTILRAPRTAEAAMRSRAEIYQLLREGAAEGVMTVAQRSMMERIHRLNTLSVRDVMVPLKSVVAIEATKTRAEIRPKLARARYSRLPVFKGTRGNIIGVAHMLDILNAREDKPIEKMARPPVLIPQSADVIEALSILQREYARMAIVTNASGKCVGIATIKDLVEEITGELGEF